MELTVNYIGGVAFQTRVRGHQIVCDQPPENGGQDAGISPPEFLLASLGTCAGFYAAQYLKTRNLPADGLSIKVTAQKAPDRPARLASFRIDVTLPGLLEERHRDGVLRAIKSCLIHNTLLHPPAVEIALETPEAELVAGH